jgi:hypothetical protein
MTRVFNTMFFRLINHGTVLLSSLWTSASFLTQCKTLGPRDIKWLSQGHPVGWLQGGYWKPAPLALRPLLSLLSQGVLSLGCFIHGILDLALLARIPPQPIPELALLLINHPYDCQGVNVTPDSFWREPYLGADCGSSRAKARTTSRPPRWQGWGWGVPVLPGSLALFLGLLSAPPTPKSCHPNWSISGQLGSVCLGKPSQVGFHMVS